MRCIWGLSLYYNTKWPSPLSYYSLVVHRKPLNCLKHGGHPRRNWTQDTYLLVFKIFWDDSRQYNVMVDTELTPVRLDFNVIIVGDSSVGKSWLAYRFANMDENPEGIRANTGVSSVVSKCVIDMKSLVVMSCVFRPKILRLTGNPSIFSCG